MQVYFPISLRATLLIANVTSIVGRFVTVYLPPVTTLVPLKNMSTTSLDLHLKEALSLRVAYISLVVNATKPSTKNRIPFIFQA